MFAYKDLEVWKLARAVTISIYNITEHFPPKERFCLVNQINRAAISIVSNIAEGSSRSSFRDQVHFYEIAYGSLMELSCQVDIAKELNYVNEKDYISIMGDFNKLAQMLSKLRKVQLERMTKTLNLKRSTLNGGN